MGSACKILGKIYGVLATIGTIYLAVVLGEVNIRGYYSSSDRNWAITIGILLGGFLSTAMIVVALHTLGEIYDKVFSSSFSNSVSISEDASKGLAALGKESEEKNIIANGGWKCPDCGKLHYSYETSCICGRLKN